ncbi:hypothetical protein DH2020_008550 [Rehmannia glutinosa]|uniref:DUF4220 domain-containing protein n=1 Tax=Rehmannia glutinosa TaxID=99300 RepID=A0ABR0X6S0_REHGL
MEIIPRLRNIFLEIFEAWNIRCAVVISLCFQILLIFLAPLRKRSGWYLTNMIIWSAYLLADWIPIYAIGSIVNSERNQCSKSGADDARAALWAPFILLHLGGPDSITAFSLEDNELWIRHLVRLIVELVTVGYVFYMASPGDFWLIAILEFLAGAIKYGERTRALYLASLGTLKVSMLPQPDAGLNYAQRMEEQASMEEARSPSDTVITKEPERIAENVTVLRDERSSHEVIQVVQEGYRSYCNTLRGLIVDYMFSSFHERNESRRFFFGLKPNEAFGVMEVELNFMYDELFTKMATVHRNYYGYLFRFTCSILIIVAFMLFKSHEKLYFVDLPITYALLVGAMILEFVALIKILFSDWTIVRLKHSTFLNVIHSIHKRVSNQARWSESISQHNLISYCLKKRFKWLVSITDHFGLKSTLDELRHKSHMHADEGIKNFIFYELKGTAQGMSDAVAREICYSRGKGAITDHENLDSVKSSVMDVEYDKSVLLWHIATDLLYFTIDAPNQDDETKPDNRQICKILSDYMLYLLVMRPTMMSEVAAFLKSDSRTRVLRR